MRTLLILVAALFLFTAAPAIAKDNPRQDKAQMLARVLGAWLDSAGDTLSGDDNTIKPTAVDGSNNTVYNIDELVINIDLGDAAVIEEYGGAEEVANRLADLLMQGLEKRGQMRAERSGASVIPPPYCGRLFGSNTAIQPVDSNRLWQEQYRQESRMTQEQESTNPHWEEGDRKYSEMRAKTSNAQEGGPDQPDRPQGRGFAEPHSEFIPPAAAGVLEHHPRREVIEMMMQIPPDVEPEFVEFMMEAGRLAREFPEFREQLEKLVQKAHEREAAEAGH